MPAVLLLRTRPGVALKDRRTTTRVSGANVCKKRRELQRRDRTMLVGFTRFSTGATAKNHDSAKPRIRWLETRRKTDVEADRCGRLGIDTGDVLFSRRAIPHPMAFRGERGPSLIAACSVEDYLGA
jgi:hypothetical protein